MSEPKRGLGPIQIGILIAALAVAAAAFTANLVGANSVCALRTSYCASSTDKNGLYKGALYGPDGKPYRDARIRVHFDSREDLSHVTFRMVRNHRPVANRAAPRFRGIAPATFTRVGNTSCSSSLQRFRLSFCLSLSFFGAGRARACSAPSVSRFSLPT